MSQDSASKGGVSRRDFVKSTGAAVAGAAVAAIASRAYAAGDDVLKVGLVGCGGRGSGAAQQALNADKNVKLTAMADAFSDRLESSLANLKKSSVGSKVEVDNDHKFVGFDACKKLLESGVDVVLLTTSPHFRPAHLKMAIEAGKHVFAEKPVAVDAPGVRSVIESCELAKKKNLSVVSGLCWRYHVPKRETIQRCIDGAIGDIRVMQVSYNTGGLWNHKRQPGWSDMEYQMRNWLYYTWLSGDHINEQHIHSLDKAMWVMKDTPPKKVTANGGRQARTSPEYGHIYDHFNCVYEWESGAKCFSSCRQIVGCDPDVSDHFFGSKGVCHVFQHEITGENKWKLERDVEKNSKDMYQQEHDELFASIRSGKPINNGDYMAKSTLMAIMGRMAAYTGKTITWEQALSSKEDLTPPKYDWTSLEMPPVAIPGVTKFA